ELARDFKIKCGEKSITIMTGIARTGPSSLLVARQLATTAADFEGLKAKQVNDFHISLSNL
ncbi:MAG: hypothetical protein ACKPKO_53365, partial [Candidatus Fonsibacter sp.]